MKKYSIIVGLFLITVLCTSTQTTSAAVGYLMTTSLTDPTCVNPVGGGYLDLQTFGILPNASLTGNSVSWNFFSSAAPINLFGTSYSSGVTFTDDGFAFLGAGTPGSNPGVPRTLPDDADPNMLLAPLWHDFEIVYDVANGANRGISLATLDGNEGAVIIEYDGVQLAGTTQIVGDFEIIIDRREGNKDIIFGYNNLNQALLNDLFTVGIENEAGDQAYAFINNTVASGNLSNGLLICFDAVTTFTVGGTVSGLETGNSLTLQNNMGDDLHITDNGNFTFATALTDGSDYAITVKNQPTDPKQLCEVTNGTGTLSGENVSNVDVTCRNKTPWTLFLPAIITAQ